MILNIPMSDTAHEYEVVLPHGVRNFTVRLRESADMLLSEVAGATVTGPYLTVPSGSTLTAVLAQVIEPTGKVLFARCPTQQGTVEVFAW